MKLVVVISVRSSNIRVSLMPGFAAVAEKKRQVSTFARLKAFQRVSARQVYVTSRATLSQ